MASIGLNRPRGWLWGIIASLWLLLAPVVAAQSGTVQIIDPNNLLNDQRAQVEQAAQQLANEGAQVIAVADNQPNAVNSQNEQAYITSLLQQNNVALINGQIAPNQIIYYVNSVQGYTGVYYGSTWRDRLNPVLRQVNQAITQQASTGNLGQGFVDGINATRTTINPPISPLIYAMGGVLLLATIGLFAVPILRRRRNTAMSLSTAKSEATQARQAAGAAIADLGQRMDNARAQAQYDTISYAAEDAQRVQLGQRRAEDAFNEAQSTFDAADEHEQLHPDLSAQDYQRLAAQYGESRELTKQAAAALSEVEQLRSTLDRQRSMPPSA